MIKDEYRKSTKLLLVKLTHYVVCIVLFYFAWLFFRYGDVTAINQTGYRYNFYATIGYGVAVVTFNRIYNAYLFGYMRVRTLAFSQLLSQVLSLLLIYVVCSVAWLNFMNPWIFAVLLLEQASANIVWSYFGNWYYFRLNPTKRTILIYRDERDRKRVSLIKSKPLYRVYEIEEEMQYDGSFHDLKDKLDDYEAILVSGVNSKCRNGIAKYCKERAIPGLFLPHIGDMIMQEARHIPAFYAPVLYVNRSHLHPEYAFIKRLTDIVASLLAIIVFSPIMLIVAIAIKLYDRGHVIYKQKRLTKDGREFWIYKFRSMRENAESDGVARLSTGDKDDRITPVGKFIRKCRLDELPQLFNILKGDMTIVGPRPERPEIAKQYCEKMPEFSLRLQVKAGLTGYAQVYGRYNTEPYEKLEFDLLYIHSMNFWVDLKLIFATIGILFMPESTEGIATGTTIAMDFESESNSTDRLMNSSNDEMTEQDFSHFGVKNSMERNAGVFDK